MIKQCLLGFTCLSLTMAMAPAPAMAAPTSFPFDGNVQKLTQEEIRIQKYKLQRLRIKLDHARWHIIRGINDKIDDFNLLKMVGQTKKIQEYEQNQLIGNSVALGGVVLLASGALLLTNIIKLDNSTLIGVGLTVAGGGMAIAGEMMAGNIGDEYFHLIEMAEAEIYIGEYNTKLKKKLGIAHVENLD